MSGARHDFHSVVDSVLTGLLDGGTPLADAQLELTRLLAIQGATVFESRREAQLAVERHYKRPMRGGAA